VKIYNFLVVNILIYLEVFVIPTHCHSSLQVLPYFPSLYIKVLSFKITQRFHLLKWGRSGSLWLPVWS